MDHESVLRTLPSAMERNTTKVDKLRITKHASGEQCRAIGFAAGCPIKLDKLDLAYNELSGSLLMEPFALMPNITQILLKGNNFPTMPSGLCSYTSTKLERLNLMDNQVSGQLPTEIGCLSVMTSMNFGDNKLSGILPSELVCW